LISTVLQADYEIIETAQCHWHEHHFSGSRKMHERQLIYYWALNNVGGRLRAIKNGVARILSSASALPQRTDLSDRLINF